MKLPVGYPLIMLPFPGGSMNTEVTAQRRGECGKHWPKRQLAYIILVEVQFCFTSTETVRTIRDGEPRTATSTFTQLLNSGA